VEVAASSNKDGGGPVFDFENRNGEAARSWPLFAKRTHFFLLVSEPAPQRIWTPFNWRHRVHPRSGSQPAVSQL